MRAAFFACPILGIALGLMPGEPNLDVRGYKKWKAANQRPIRMSDVMNQLCVGPRGPQLASVDEASLHRPYFLKVYVNAEGRHQFARPKMTPMPVGSVIVKEKLKSTDSLHPTLLTIMRKREAGYDSKNGDWEYAVADGSLKIVEQGRIERCIGCHSGQAKSDFLYRSYMPFRSG